MLYTERARCFRVTSAAVAAAAAVATAAENDDVDEAADDGGEDASVSRGTYGSSAVLIAS